jgi:hypothetical protein
MCEVRGGTGVRSTQDGVSHDVDFCYGLMLCDMYVMKLLCYGTLKICDAMLSDVYVVLNYVL